AAAARKLRVTFFIANLHFSRPGRTCILANATLTPLFLLVFQERMSDGPQRSGPAFHRGASDDCPDGRQPSPIKKKGRRDEKAAAPPTWRLRSRRQLFLALSWPESCGKAAGN